MYFAQNHNIHPLAEPVVNEYPLVGEVACLPEVIDGYVRGIGAGGEGGTAVELVEWGYAGDNDALMSSALGAPQDGSGVVLVNFTDRDDGVLDGVLPERIQPPPFGNVARFGEALLAADVLSGAQSGNLDMGYGEELLIGAPGMVAEDNGGEGVLFAYRGNWDTIDIPTRYWERDTRYQPPGLPMNAEFGAAIAAPFDGGPGNFPDWIAVGAPGEDAVYLLDVHRNPAAASRFSVLQVIRPDPGHIGTRFGSALAVADLDGDGRQDLAVGAPDDSSGGSVFVFSGNPAGCGPVWVGQTLSTAAIHLESDLYGATDLFGHALAVGRIFGDDQSRLGLVVGVPGEDGSVANAGAICQFRIDTDAAACPKLAEGFIRCHDNPDAEADAYFGAALAVGDFVPLDNLGSFTGHYARVDEIAVGSPYQSSDTVTDSGVVSVFEPVGDGLDLDAYPDPLTSLLDYNGDQTDGAFGASLARGFVQDTPFEDLVIGAPGTGPVTASAHGSLTLTKAALQGSSFPCSNLSGTYLGYDSLGQALEGRVFWAADELHFELGLHPDEVGEMTLEVRDEDGNFCTYGDDFDGQFLGELDLPAVAWTCGTSTTSFSVQINEGPDLFLEGTLSHDGASTFDLKIDESGALFTALNLVNLTTTCAILGNEGAGFSFTQDEAFGCE